MLLSKLNSNKNALYSTRKMLKSLIGKKVSINQPNKFFTETCIKKESISNLGEQSNKKIDISIEKSDYGFNKSHVIFFDFQSTTPIDPRVLDAMLPYMTYQYGNPHSKSHEYGWNAEKAVEISRKVKIIN